MSFPIPWAALHDAGLLLAVCGLLSLVAWAVYKTTVATIRRERDAWLVAQLPEIAQHEVLSARREAAEQRTRAETAERELADALLRLEAVRRALDGVAPASVARVLQISGRRRFDVQEAGAR